MANPVQQWWDNDAQPSEKPGLKVFAFILAGVLCLAMTAKAWSVFA